MAWQQVHMQTGLCPQSVITTLGQQARCLG